MMYFSYFNLALVIVVAALTALSYYKGKRLLFSIIVSFYPAMALYAAFPYKAQFILFKSTDEQVFYSHVLIFAVFFIASFLMACRIVHSDGMQRGIMGFVDALLLSISVVLLTVALTLHILPTRDIYSLSASIQNFFTKDIGYFVSVLVPIAVIYWMGRRY